MKKSYLSGLFLKEFKDKEGKEVKYIQIYITDLEKKEVIKYKPLNTVEFLEKISEYQKLMFKPVELNIDLAKNQKGEMVAKVVSISAV